MSFRDCIQSAVDTGRVSAKKAAEAFAEYDREYARATSVGEPDGVADGLAADASLKHITTLKAAKRWDRLNTMQRAHELHTRFQGVKDPSAELGKIPLEMELAQEAVRSIAMGALDSFMQRFGPKVAGIKKLGDDVRGVIRAAYDEGGTAADKLHADAVIAVREMLRKWANMYGASIPENANAKIPQTHDPVRVRKVEEDEWVQDHINNLDWDIMRFRGELIPVDKRDEILRHTYQGIINEGFDRGDPAQLHQISLGNRLNRDRFLYYKNADSYIAMQEKYGAGNFYEQTIGMVETMAKDISILKTFGPGPDAMKEFTKRVAGLRASELNNAAPLGKRETNKIKRARALFDREYQIHSWHTPTADGNLPVQTFATVRTTAVTALLGKSFFSNLFSDMANSSIMKRVVGLPHVSVFRSYSKEFLSSKRAKMEAAQLGVIQENMMSLVQARVRYFGTLDGPAAARRISDLTYRLGIVSYHTQVHRNGQGKQLLGQWAIHANTRFDDLPFAPFLIESHITEKDWDLFRATPLTDVRGAKFLVPRAMFEAGDDEAKKVAEKFAASMQLFIRVQVPDTSLRSRAALGESLDPNTVAAQSVRTMSSLMSFPVAIWFEQINRIASLPNIRDKIRFMAAYFTAMTMAGMAIVQAKDIITGGYNPNAYNDPEFLLRSAQAGGGLGVVGDFIFNSINMNNSNRMNSNPTFDWLAKAKDLTYGNMAAVVKNYGTEHNWWEADPEDINVSADAYALIDASVPDLWQTQLLFNRAIKDDILRTLDPAGWERKQRYLRESHQQGMWWEPGGQPQAPNLATAMGSE